MSFCGAKTHATSAKIEDDLIRFYPDEGHMYSRSGLVRQGIDLALHDLLGLCGQFAGLRTIGREAAGPDGVSAIRFFGCAP